MHDVIFRQFIEYMIEYQYIVAPLVGGLIGYITNDIAIRMLFRPHKAKYLFGRRLPFTPGIIPKEKGRLAESIGNVISENLMSKDVLEKYLLSDVMLSKIRSSVNGFIKKQKNNGESLKSFLSHYISEKEIDSLFQSANENISKQISVRLSDSKLGNQIAHLAVDQVIRKIEKNEFTEILSDLKNAVGVGGLATKLFGKNILKEFFSALRQPVEEHLGKQINNILQENSEKMSAQLIGDESQKLLSTSVRELLKGKDEQLAHASSMVLSLYTKVIKEHLPKILSSIDISTIVRERINEMDVCEAEKIILQVLDKELKAIVWLGALLGLIMGCINIVI